MNQLERKYARLVDIIKGYGSVLVAYSGGVDSTLVLRAAKDAFGADPGKVLAVTADSYTVPRGEVGTAAKICKKIGAKHVTITTDELKNKKFARNPVDRCYYCKKELIDRLKKIASERGINVIADGTNASDVTGDFRPGMRALKESKVHSPLAEAGLTKEDVRKISRVLGLETSDKPSSACLASRFPYGSPLTREKINRVAKAEDFIKKRYEIRVVRVRDYDGLARVEVAKNEMGRVLKKQVFEDITRKLKSLGFTYVTIDMEGYRSGSMNEVL
jgi:uncharacterized protein